MMQRSEFMGAILIAVALLPGCADTERDDLRAKATGLERELSTARSALEQTNRQVVELRAQVEAQHAEADKLTKELVTVKVQRDKLKQELAALQRKRR